MLLVIPFFFLCMGIEWLYGKWKEKNYYRFNDTITNLNIGIGNQIFGLLLKGLNVGIFIWVADHWSLFQISNSWISWLLCLLLFDFLYYWAHRWSHEVNILWAAHVVHHSSEEYNLSVALRQSWFHTTMAAFIFLPIPLIGFQPVTFLTVAGFVTLYQFWIHTEAIDRLPRWFEMIFNSPAHHRVHHARNEKYIDRNYAATFIFWDRMFGTYKDEEERPTYGITQNIRSWNPTWANLHYFVELWDQSKDWKNWKHRLQVLIKRPGWQPENEKVKSTQHLTNQGHQKYNASRPLMNAYVTSQFILIAIGLLAYMAHYENLTSFFQLSLAALMILSMMVSGAVMEGKKWVIAAEYVKLILAVLCLNSLYFHSYLDWFLVMLLGSTTALLVFTIWFTISVKEKRLHHSATNGIF